MAGALGPLQGKAFRIGHMGDLNEIMVLSALAGTDAWFWIVSAAGLATLLVGAWAAIFQHDLKGLLAYSTISHLGLITLLEMAGADLKKGKFVLAEGADGSSMTRTVTVPPSGIASREFAHKNSSTCRNWP